MHLLESCRLKEVSKLKNTRMEDVTPEDGGPPVARPVVRLPEVGLVFTRIDAGRRETSMIMHIRPGWPSLRDYLRPQTDMSTG